MRIRKGLTGCRYLVCGEKADGIVGGYKDLYRIAHKGLTGFVWFVYKRRKE
jgi:hypothetical protein